MAPAPMMNSLRCSLLNCTSAKAWLRRLVAADRGFSRARRKSRLQ
jgi:hypothetical protein